MCINAFGWIGVPINGQSRTLSSVQLIYGGFAGLGDVTQGEKDTQAQFPHIYELDHKKSVLASLPLQHNASLGFLDDMLMTSTSLMFKCL